MKADYRPDIDGLRAVAVLSVLCFHGFPDVLRGGFVGVDIFFVISGFLITGIILAEITDGTFTFARFYARRVRRIFPALAVVLACTLVAGWLFLFPVDFRGLGIHVAAGAGFVSNLALWKESGYFDTDAELKPLLHLWSLGVEEQYYVIWPILLVLADRARHRILPLLVLIAVTSFALNIALLSHHPSAAFYSPPTRFWELMVGGFLAYANTFRAPLSQMMRAKGDILSVLGAGLLLIAFVVTREDHFPGWWALLPTLGAALIIGAGSDSVVGRVLGHRLAVYIGLISYPLYLWHWPLLTYARILHGDVPSVFVRCAMLALSVLLADLTYRFVERGVRRRAREWVVPGLAAAMAGIGACALLVLTGRVQSVSASTPHLAEISAAISDWEGSREWTRGDSDHVVMFFGDSLAQQYWPRIADLVHEHSAPLRSIVFHTAGGCAPILGIERRGQNCASFTTTGYDRARKPDVDIVVIACAWVGFLERTDYYDVAHPSDPPLNLRGPPMDELLKSFEESLQDLRARGKQIVIVMTSPGDLAFDPARMLHRNGWLEWTVIPSAPVPRRKLDLRSAPIEPRIRDIARRVGATVLEPMAWLCTKDWCPALDDAGRPLYMDASHLRALTVRERFTGLDEFVYLPSVTTRNER